jgi:hypothetical protein
MKFTGLGKKVLLNRRMLCFLLNLDLLVVATFGLNYSEKKAFIEEALNLEGVYSYCRIHENYGIPSFQNIEDVYVGLAEDQISMDKVLTNVMARNFGPTSSRTGGGDQGARCMKDHFKKICDKALSLAF